MEYIVLDYPRKPNLISQENMSDYEGLANLYGKRYGIDPNLLLAVMAENKLEHNIEVDARGRIGLMKVPYERMSNPNVYYDYVDETFGTKSFSLDELSNMGTNVEAWCILFQHYLYDNNYNILVALELINEDYANTVFNAISTYTNTKYDLTSDYENPKMYNYRLGVMDYSDLTWLNYLMDDHGKIYSEDVLSYLPESIVLSFKSLDDGVIGEDILITVKNKYK